MTNEEQEGESRMAQPESHQTAGATALPDVAESHSIGPWDWTVFGKADGTPIETVQDVADTIASSAHWSPRAELFGVTLRERAEDGGAIVVCYTGNGPRSHINARLIAAAPDFYAAAQSLIYGHDEAARLANFDRCGCDTCRTLRPVLAKAEGQS